MTKNKACYINLSLCHSEPLGEDSKILQTALQNLRISSTKTR
ncbi:hypothetical protein [Helicobacter himalayensis]|nr:hypothetical protein [Helicobacter himalayensis]